MDPPDDVDHLVDLYDSTLRDIVDEHAHLRTKEMPTEQCFHGTIRTNRLQGDTEGIVSGCVHFEMFKVSKIIVKNTLASAKSEYYNKTIKASKGNQRTVFSVMNKVL